MSSTAQAVAFIFATGAECVSPSTVADRVTVIEKVQCARPVLSDSANPFKIAQEPNVISAAAAKPKAVRKAVEKAKRKAKARKKKRKARR